MKYQAVLFDLDGTFLDTAPDFVTASQQLAMEINHPDAVDSEQVRKAVTHGSKGILQEVFALDETSSEFEAVRSRFLDLYYSCLADKTRPFPGITELLNTLDQHNTPWGIVTNKPERYTSAILQQLPLPSRPLSVVCPDHVTQTKPHPESIFLACQQLACEASKTLYIGDHLRDIQAGQAAGADTIAASYGYLDQGEDPYKWQADHVVTHASQIADLLF